MFASKKFQNMFFLTDFLLGCGKNVVNVWVNVWVNIPTFFFFTSHVGWLVETMNQYVYVKALQFPIFYWQIEIEYIERVRLVRSAYDISRT